MKQAWIATIVACLAATCCLPVEAQPVPQPVSVSGAFYRFVPGGVSAPAFQNLKVYLTPPSTDRLAQARIQELNGSVTIGPSFTDAYGRFSFTGVPAGSYILRAYLGKNRVWEQPVEARSSQTLSPIVVDTR
jgi:hypothetical protein